jgi:hypothetical protein
MPEQRGFQAGRKSCAQNKPPALQGASQFRALFAEHGGTAGTCAAW